MNDSLDLYPHSNTFAAELAATGEVTDQQHSNIRELVLQAFELARSGGCIAELADALSAIDECSAAPMALSTIAA